MLKQNLIRKNLFLCKHCVTIRIYEDSLFKRTEQVVSLSALAGDFSPKSKNPIKGSPDVNMENGTKKLSLAVFFPRKRKQSCHMLTDFSCITWLLTDKIELYRLFHILRKKTPSGCELPFALLTTLPLQNILQWYL
jgi:hypothetical protein